MNVKSRLLIGEWITRILLVVFSLLVLYPFLWNIISSFKTNQEFLSDQLAFTKA
jgi:N-acetylglucosamine transport system permease protein